MVEEKVEDDEGIDGRMMMERSKRSRDDGRRYEDMMRLWRIVMKEDGGKKWTNGDERRDGENKENTMG